MGGGFGKTECRSVAVGAAVARWSVVPELAEVSLGCGEPWVLVAERSGARAGVSAEGVAW